MIVFIKVLSNSMLKGPFERKQLDSQMGRC